jgi:hypothetical protein
MRHKRHITATELAECCVCEQRVVLDRLQGRRRTAEAQQQMAAGEAAHAALHREALREGAEPAGDGRCFVATALWGPSDPRTKALRAWRDGWLLRRWWGPSTVDLYYAVSPWLVRLMVRAPRLRQAVDVGVSAIVRCRDSRQA